MPNGLQDVVRNSDGSVSAVVNGVRVVLGASDVRALSSAAETPTTRPLLITTGSGKQYGQSGPALYGKWWGTAFGKTGWHSLDAAGRPIENTCWKNKNMNRARFKFQMAS